MPRRGEADEWVGVVLPAYAAARKRHARFRADAYDVVHDDVIARGLCGPEFRVADIDGQALAAWERTWTGSHPSGAGRWNWPALMARLPRRAAVLPSAVWVGDDLCALVLGHASRPRLNGSRHTLTLTHVERRPEPPPVPLRGNVVFIAITIAENYGLAVGARRLRLRAPDRRLVGYYERVGFHTVWKGGIALYGEQEIVP